LIKSKQKRPDKSGRFCFIQELKISSPMKTKLSKIIFSLVFSILIIACSKNAATNTNTTATCNPNTSYSATIIPLFNSNCNTNGCHDGNNAAALNTYQVIHDNATQIRASVSTGRMPKDKPLSATDKSAILCWIDNGSKNN